MSILSQSSCAVFQSQFSVLKCSFFKPRFNAPKVRKSTGEESFIHILSRKLLSLELTLAFYNLYVNDIIVIGIPLFAAVLGILQNVISFFRFECRCKKAESMDEHCVLLSSGYKMPLMGLGMWQNDEEELVPVALEAAIDAGYRHIDTAFAYKNEAFIGKALKKIFQKGTVKREDLFITTKLPSNGMKPENVEEFFKKSLDALQLDYVDLYLIHSPFASQRTEDDNEIFCIRNGVFQFDSSVDFVDTWRAMEALVHKGLTKSIGLSNFNSLQIQRIYDSAEIKPANLQVECHAYFPQYELQEYCRLLSISLTAYAPIGSPGLAAYATKRGFSVEKQDSLMEDDKLNPLCVKHKKTAAQILLRYLVQRDITVIPKSTNPKRIEENIKIFDFKLDDEDMKILSSMKKNKRMFHFDFAKGMKEHPEYPFNLPF